MPLFKQNWPCFVCKAQEAFGGDNFFTNACHLVFAHCLVLAILPMQIGKSFCLQNERLVNFESLCKKNLN
jgi:hypothetical protein